MSRSSQAGDAGREAASYHRGVKSVADELRAERLGRPGADGAEARVVTALRLGDSAVALRQAASGETEAVARRVLERQGARGRRPSRCAER